MQTSPATPTLTPTMQGLRDSAEKRGLATVTFAECGRTYLRIGSAKTFRSLEIVASAPRDMTRASHAATFDGRKISLKEVAGYMSLMSI